MKFNITKLFAGVLCATSMFSMTSCLDETFPTSAALENQVQEAGAKGTEALMWAMPAFLNNFNTQGSEAHYDWGYGAIMHIRDVMTGDMTVVASSYDWFSSWAQCTGIGESTARAQFIWNYYYKFIKTANSFLATVDTASVSTDAEL